MCHVHAYNYFGGVTRLRILDNCKTAKTSNTRYETVLNQSCQALSDHHGTAIVPACVRKPDDKATAEGSMRFISTWITTALRDRKLFTLAKANAGVAEKLGQYRTIRWKRWRCLFRHLPLADLSIDRQ